MSIIRVAIVGKTNVGKSTLFNKLCRKKLALVDDQPNLTRDYKEYDIEVNDVHLRLLDTAGWQKDHDPFNKDIIKQAFNAAQIAEILLFMVDAKHGLSSEDQELASNIRKLGKQVIVVANKAESKKSITDSDLYKFGFGEAVFISAEHMIGIMELQDRIYDCWQQLTKGQDPELHFTLESHDTIKVAIVGRPNVGKSTLLNAILGYERVITSEIAGTTRDAIATEVTIDEHRFTLIDTAGMRKKRNIHERIENFSVAESISAIRRANVVLLVVDAQEPFEKQEMTIAHLIGNEGKPVIVVMNKFDLIKDKKTFLSTIRTFINENIWQIRGAPVVTISALKKQSINRVFQEVVPLYKNWCSEISTGKLNRWLRDVIEQHTTPLSNDGRRIKLKYITQTGTKPPTFTIFSNIPEDLPLSYSRYLANNLKDKFNLNGVPIRFKLKKGGNPYQET